MFTVSYKLKKADYNNLIRLLSKTTNYSYLLALWIGFFVIFIAMDLYQYQDIQYSTFVFLGSLFVIFAFIKIYSTKLYSPSDNFLADTGYFLQPRKFTINKVGIVDKSDSHCFNTKWKGVLKIESTDDYILYFIDKAQVYLVPKRSFELADEAQKFFDTSIKFWKDSK